MAECVDDAERDGADEDDAEERRAGERADRGHGLG